MNNRDPASKSTTHAAKRGRQFVLPLEDELLVDEFACGGGMSEAIEQAIGRHVDISVNHDDDACSMHRVNHPQTEHFCADVFGKEVAPRVVTRGRPVGLLHMSPDCTDHSQAKGGQPRSRKLRALSWIGVRWAGQVRPRIITLENVKQIRQWGPLIAKRCKCTGRVVKLDGSVAGQGERVPVEQQYLVPDPSRSGKTWRRFTGLLRRMGYEVEDQILCAADHAAPTTRRRLFMVARCDGAPIVWPEASHAETPERGQAKWRAAAEIIDWSIQGKSIFDRLKPLADATLRRVAHGLKRYVLDSGAPFIVPVTHTGGVRVHDIRDPLRTVTTARRGEFMLAAPTLVKFRFDSGGGRLDVPLPTITSGGASKRPAGAAHALGIAAASLVQMGYGEREGQAPRALDIDRPLGTVTGGGGKFGLVTAFVEQANGGFNDTPARDVREPLSTITQTGSQQRPVTAHLLHLRGHCDVRDLNDPVQTISAGGQHHAFVEYHLSPEAEEGALRCAAFLIHYYGEGGQWNDLRDPMATITTKDRLALVTVWIEGDPYVIVDICLRMLTPRELYNAQGFPPDYIIEHGHDGRVFSKSTQVRMVGNAVPPPLGKAVIKAQWESRAPLRAAA